MSKTLIWTENGDIEMAGGRILTTAGVSAIQNRIFYLLRSGFDMSKHVGKAVTQANMKAFQIDLQIFLNRNLPIELPVTVVTVDSHAQGFNVHLLLETEIVEEERTFYFSYTNGLWHYTYLTTTPTPVQEPEIPHVTNLMDR